MHLTSVNIILFLFLNFNNINNSVFTNPQEGILVDSDLSLEEALHGIVIPEHIKNILTLIDVSYYSFDGKLHKGQLVIHKDLVDDIRLIFELIKKKQIPYIKCHPISKIFMV